MSDFNFKNAVSAYDLETKTVKDLRAMCAELGLTKYSKAPKPILIEMINGYYTGSLMELTANELRAMCTDRGFTGVAKTNKANLIKLLFETLEPAVLADPTDPEDSVSVGDLIGISSDGSVSVGDLIDISSDDSVEEEEESTSTGTITVVNGARSRTIPFEEGKTVWDIHQQMANEMGIAAHPSFTVNDTDAPNNVIIREGDTIEFFKVSGTKGYRGTLLEKC